MASAPSSSQKVLSQTTGSQGLSVHIVSVSLLDKFLNFDNDVEGMKKSLEKVAWYKRLSWWKKILKLKKSNYFKKCISP